MREKIVQTAGRDRLGDFAPEFAHFNDDILFGENWNNADIDLKTRCIITVVALVASGVTDSSLTYHLQNAKANGLSKSKIVAILTHVAFYAGWPKAWAAFNQAKEVWNEEASAEATEMENYQKTLFSRLSVMVPSRCLSPMRAIYTLSSANGAVIGGISL